MTKRQVIWICCVACALLLLAIPFDLRISMIVYDPKNLFGIIFEAIGELPGFLIAIVSCVALIITGLKKSKISKLINIFGFGLLLVPCCFLAGILPFNYLKLPLWPGVILGIVYLVSAFWMISKIPQSRYAELRRAAMIGLGTFLFSVISVSLIKMGWGRLRFRDLSGSVSGFTAWYFLQKWTINNELMSFPSGHAANAAVIIVITLLPTILPHLKKYSRNLFAGAICWIVLVMISRVIIGAHFMSDVVAGASTVLLAFALLTKIVKLKK